MIEQRSEFTVTGAFAYDHRGPVRWLLSHGFRYGLFLGTAIALYLASHISMSYASVLVGRAASLILEPSIGGSILIVALALLGLKLVEGVTGLLAAYAVEVIAKRVERDARQELVASLLGKSQTFHDRQRVGDIMARATDDVQQISGMIMPGLSLLFETVLGMATPVITIALIEPRMVLVPLTFVGLYIVAVRDYARRLNPVTVAQRRQFGRMNSGLEETISGIEIVKASAQEAYERLKFRGNARGYRDLYVQQGEIEARYLPFLLYGVAVGATFAHGLFLFRAGTLSIPDLVAIMALMGLLRFPSFFSIFTLSLIQLGLASADRILEIIRADTDLDENRGGHAAPIRGGITFEDVTFGYGGTPVLQDLSFQIEPGQTVAIVGQTGSGKSTLTQLINRTHDVSRGRLLIDGVDVREWSLDALRSQISKIEQDVFLFSRSLAENIAFGAPQATRAQIEAAAREAQAHDFILSFSEGYETVVGERGVTLSGGQRQRIALARAFLSNPRILILDDSTSAIDSATEDEIQRALLRAQEGRTTLLITHRLSQIRWADLILVLDNHRIVAQGSHESLLAGSPHYRRIFARYEIDLPPLLAVGLEG